jgi:hypothetical protein
VTSNITMYDAIDISQIPASAQAVAGYTDGDWPTYGSLVEQFPKADHLSIAVNPAGNGDALDVEPGDAPPESAVAWYAAQRARGLARPCLYASADTMEEFAVPVIEAALIPRTAVRLWTAHYGAGEHICGPKSCGALSIDADGTQWCNDALGRPLDQSSLLGDFFTVPTPVPPADWTFGPPVDLRAIGGRTSARLAWSPPAGAPEPVSRYHIYIYQGAECTRSTLVSSYPRGTAATSWEGGSLAEGRQYTAHVVAAGAEGTHVRSFCFGSVTFTTG